LGEEGIGRGSAALNPFFPQFLKNERRHFERSEKSPAKPLITIN
jgi:hypothetical protein